jgi:hypothetical protein
MGRDSMDGTKRERKTKEAIKEKCRPVQAPNDVMKIKDYYESSNRHFCIFSVENIF